MKSRLANTLVLIAIIGSILAGILINLSDALAAIGDLFGV